MELSELEDCCGLHFHHMLVIIKFNFLCFVNIITRVVVIVLTFPVTVNMMTVTPSKQRGSSEAYDRLGNESEASIVSFQIYHSVALSVLDDLY